VERERTRQESLAKSRFLASASHDLRQPVHALSMLVDALRMQTMDAEAARLLGFIQESVTAMSKLFNALLDISRLDAGVVKPRPQTFSIHSLLERVCRDYSREALQKGIRVVWHPCSLSLYTDEILLEQILRNLISNAVRYTDRGRVVVGCRRGSRVSIEVWDTGRGIPPTEQKRVFQEFYQLGNFARDRAMGFGLGLAIVSRLAELLNLSLTLKSIPGKGSVFKIAVPTASAVPDALREPVVTSDMSMLASRRGEILVVDDDVAIQEGMRSLLAAWGHKVTVGGSREEILGRIESETIPDIIICDYRLSAGENGFEVIDRLRCEYNREIPSILITGDTAPDLLKEAHESGLILLHKPVAAGKLRAVIGNLLSARMRPGA
jgi:CheY-like chemotaxis protein/two-component sensor histidine kinase